MRPSQPPDASLRTPPNYPIISNNQDSYGRYLQYYYEPWHSHVTDIQPLHDPNSEA